MIYVHALIGLPGVGKSSLMRRIIARLGGLECAQDFKHGLTVGHYFPSQRIVILGKYDDPAQIFSGTDRLSMAAQPPTLALLTACTKRDDWDGTIFLFEGDRLTSLNFFKQIEQAGATMKVWEVSAPDSVRAERCVARGSNQSKQFIQGRATKIEKIAAAMPVSQLHNPAGTDLNLLALRVIEMASRPYNTVFKGNMPDEQQERKAGDSVQIPHSSGEREAA